MITIIFCNFAPASTYCGYNILHGQRSRWVERYILKGVTDALFLYFETSTCRIANKNNAGVTPRSVLYTTP